MAEYARWFVVHTYSGYENKVASNIETAVENRRMQDQIFEVRVPMEKVTEIKDEQKKEIERKKAEIAAQDKALEQQDRKNESLLNELMLAERDIRVLEAQQRKAQKILDHVPEDVRKEIEKQLKKEARNRGYER